MREGPLDAVVHWGEPIPFDFASDRKRATAEAEAAVREAVYAALRTPDGALAPRDAASLFSRRARALKEGRGSTVPRNV
jgi:hypothetical protein